MRTPAKGHHEEEEYEDDEYGSKKEGPSSNNNSNSKADAKNNDKASAVRSKHSVTEQRRRSKINERFQILRDLVPHSDQKRDTASFLLEVIEYVQFLQEKVHKFEGSYQGWSAEPTKLIPWRNSHWRVQNFVGHPPQNIKNGPAAAFPGKFDESHISISPTMLTSPQNLVESDPSRDVACKTLDRQPEAANKGVSLPIPTLACMSTRTSDGMLTQPLQIPVESQSTQCPTTSDGQNQPDEFMVEGGTISVTSAYSQGWVCLLQTQFLGRLLNTLAQALQNAGLDLSQASISVQIDLGKRANKLLSSGTSVSKDYENVPSSNQTIGHRRDAGVGEDSDQGQKRLKT
ncbi:hypothetical protein G4B88_012506 [Cannabis sativa]|uniref:BHLH domain-containing protein n=1 Tax=Cannabis sativa TaxID=3483 RepID=A0A7J6I6N7_CANSA|nr:hypothetical protein G4B88_012506 [Cannabis sativa]